MDQRGFTSTQKMNQFMIEQWNHKVKANDEVIILGDFSFGEAKETEDVLKQLNGSKVLIKGNHERYLKDRSFNKNLYKKISQYEDMMDNGRKTILCHYPVFCYNGQNRIDENRKPRSYMLYGHVHNTEDQSLIEKFIAETRNTKRNINGTEMGIPCNMINCFCMRSNYVPLSLDEWIVLENK